jgi:hypothetical protein
MGYIQGKWLGAVGVGTVALAAALLGLRMAAPEWGRNKLLLKLREACPECRFDVRELDLSFLAGKVVARDPGFLGDPADGTHFGAVARALSVDFEVWALLQGKIRIEEIVIEGMDLTVADYADSPPNTKPPSYPWLATLPEVRVEKVVAKDAKFTYALDPPADQKVPHSPDIPGKISIRDALKIRKHRSYLPFHSIDAEGGAFGTQRGISPDFVLAKAEGHAGEDGRVKVEVKIGLFENEKIDDIEIEAKNVNASLFNSMLVPEEGMRIQGKLNAGTAKLEVRKRKLTTRMSVDYDGLEIKHLKGHEGRSGFKTFLAQVASLALVHRSKRADGSVGEHSTQIVSEQKPFDNVFTFLVDGLTQAALKIIRSG